MLVEQKPIDLFVARVNRAFWAVIQNVFTRLSTGSVDNRTPLMQRGFERSHSMKAPWRFLRFLPMAQRVLARGRLPVVLLAVARKRSAKGGLIKGLREDLSLLQSLCVAWWRGEYRAISKPALVAVVAGLLYFLSPLDAIPDWIPGLGFVDDLAVLAWVMRKWAGELQAFRDWKDRQPAEVLADITRLPTPDEPMVDTAGRP